MFLLWLALIGFAVGLTILTRPKKAMRSNGNRDTLVLGQGASAKSTYKAPLLDPDPRLRKIPMGYWVLFHPGHTFIAHRIAIGIDIEPHIRSIYALGKSTFEGGRVDNGIIIKPFTESDYPPKDVSIHYDVRDIDSILLDAIRSDPGVELVEYHNRMQKEKEVD